MATRGRAIVTDLKFWKTSPNWAANDLFLRGHGALIVEGINVFQVNKGMPSDVDFQKIGLVVVGGFAPHYRGSAAVQALSHQIPDASLMFLYASRDKPPDYQDTDKVHIQAWTADATRGYVVLAGRDGQGGRSRCWSPESVDCRGVESDPALVKLSIFTDAPSSVAYVHTKISPSRYVEHFLASNKDVLFCAEGDASLSCSCLKPPTQEMSVNSSPSTGFPLERGRYHEYYGPMDNYQWLLDQCSTEHVHEGSPAKELQNMSVLHGGREVPNATQLERVADMWADAWPAKRQRT